MENKNHNEDWETWKQLMEARLAEVGGGSYTQTDRVVWIKTTTKTLIEDDELINDLFIYTKNRYKLNGKDFTLADIKNCIKLKYLVGGIFKLDPKSDSGYEEEYHDGSRWEGDYNPDDAYWYPKKLSFSTVIDSFIKDFPTKVRWDIREEWTKKED